MSKRKINKFKVFIVIFVLIVFFMSITGLGRFAYNTIRDRYLSSKSFYFTSNLLTANGISYGFDNWEGDGIYEIDIELFSQKDDLERYDEPLPYTLEISYNDTDILCSPDSGNFKEQVKGDTVDVYTGEDYVIPTSTHNDKITLHIKPANSGDDNKLELGEQHTIEIKAYTKVPYKKTLSATFTFEINEISYYIEDHIDRPYIIFNVRNVSNYATDVSVNFDRDVVRLDLNDTLYTWDKNLIKEIRTDNRGIVTGFTFFMNKESSRDIKFYKTSDSNPVIEQKDISDIFEVEKVEEDGT